MKKEKKTEMSIHFKEIVTFYNNFWDKEEKENKKNIDVGWEYEQRRIHLTIFDYLKVNEKFNLLEIGCGKGDLSEKLVKKFGGIVAFDISSIGIKKTKQRINEKNECEFLLGDATNIPFQNHKFDIVICSEVLEHIPDQEKVIQEIF